MADVAQLNLTEKGAEAKLRSLLEDVVEYHVDVYPNNRLALAVWFGKSRTDKQRLLELFSGLPMTSFETTQFSLFWKTGSQSPPFVEIAATSVDHFSHELGANPSGLADFFDRPQILYFDKSLLNDAVLRKFNIVTEPPGLIKGWYLSADQYEKLESVKNILSSYSRSKPPVGLVKTYDPPDAENCRGLLHVEVDQRWVPLSPDGLKIHTFFNDLQEGRPGVFLFQGGSLYRPLKFEEKAEPAYSKLVLERLPHDRYPEVYLRSVHPSQQPAA